MAGKTVCAEGLMLPEGGPVVLPDGSVIFVEIYGGRVSRWDPATNTVSVVADVGGGPNAVIRDRSGEQGVEFVLTQSGGVAGSWRSANPRPPGIQRIMSDGSVTYLCTEVAGKKLLAPNDLCFDDTGTLYFTDPSEGYAPANPQAQGRIYAISPHGDGRWWNVGPVFPNGIAWTGSTILWTESYTRRVVQLVGDTTEVVAELPEGHVPDGLAIDDTGTMYIATCRSGGIDIIGPAGWMGFLHIAGGVYATNCALGPGGELYVTDAADLSAEDPKGKLWTIDRAEIDRVLGQSR